MWESRFCFIINFVCYTCNQTVTLLLLCLSWHATQSIIMWTRTTMTMLTAKKVRVGVTGAAPCFIDSSDEPMKLTVSSHISWLRLSRLGMTHASAAKWWCKTCFLTFAAKYLHNKINNLSQMATVKSIGKHTFPFHLFGFWHVLRTPHLRERLC